MLVAKPYSVMTQLYLYFKLSGGIILIRQKIARNLLITIWDIAKQIGCSYFAFIRL